MDEDTETLRDNIHRLLGKLDGLSVQDSPHPIAVKLPLARVNSNPPSKALPPAPSALSDPSRSSEYSYVATEFRPVRIDECGAITTRVDDNRPPEKIGSDDPYNYAEVAFQSTGDCQDWTSNKCVNHYDSEEYEDHLYTDVKKTSSTLVTEEEEEVSNRDSDMLYDIVAQPAIPVVPPDMSDLYAQVDFSKKRKASADDIYQLDRCSPKNADDFRKGIAKSRNRSLFTHFVRMKKDGIAPSIPKPYESRSKQGSQSSLPEKDVPESLKEQLTSSSRSLVSADDMLGSHVTVPERYMSKETRSRSAFDVLDDNCKVGSARKLSKSQDENGVLIQTKPNAKEFKKQHRRMHSHENVPFFNPRTNIDDLRVASDPSRKSSVGSGVMTEHFPLTLSTSKESDEDDGMCKYSLLDLPDLHKAADSVADDLPEGWQEVKDGLETYYWHIWTGTIQYERPYASPSSRSTSPYSSQDSGSSRAASITESDQNSIKSQSSVIANDKSDSSPDKGKQQAISFPVHSMGWVEVDKGALGSIETICNCISMLAEKRNDLWKTSETWGEGKDIKLILESEQLKLYEPKSRQVLLVQPIAKMRMWGVGKEESRDFGYIARDRETDKHKCHVFRCHGTVSGRAIASALHSICNRVLDEKRKQKERAESGSGKTTSDLLRPPSRTTTDFNVKQYNEQKKCFTAKYVGSTEVSKLTGIDILNKAVNKVSEGQQISDWPIVLVEVTTSEIRVINCLKQQVSMEHRVRFITFLGVARDKRFCAYIVMAAKDTFICHVFFCAPDSGTLTKAIEEACKMRFEKLLDGKVQSKVTAQSESAGEVHEPALQLPSSPAKLVKEKTKAITSTIAGVFGKLQKKDSKKKDDDVTDSRPSLMTPGRNEYLIKYFGFVAVACGIGIETVENAVLELSGGEMMVGYLEVQPDCIILLDSQRTALSKRVFDVNHVSYCGMTSDRKHFGLIVSRGKGKYNCHVFQEYKPNLGQVVSAIHEVR